MIIKEKSLETLLFLPKNIQNLTKICNLSLKSEVTNEMYNFDNIEDKDNLIDYYKFICNFENLPDGEYVYNVDNEATGLLILGDYSKTVDNIEYTDAGNNKYIIYRDE